MNQKNKRLVIGGIGGFFGGGMGALAGSSSTWINVLVGAFGAVVVVLLANGFIKD